MGSNAMPAGRTGGIWTGTGTGTAGGALKNALLAEEEEDAILSWCSELS
jgi:hypothetical protein